MTELLRSKADLLVVTGVLALVAFVMVMFPAGVWFLVAIPVVLGGFVLTAHRFAETLLILATLCMVFVVFNYPGLDPGEVVYYLLWAASVGLLLIPLLLTGSIRAETTLDRLYIVILCFMIFGIAIGVYFSGSVAKPFQEVLYFYSGVAFYFLYRNQMNSPTFRVGLMISFVILFLYVVIRTYLSYRNAILQAVAEWELNFARGAGNENILLIGTIVCLVSLLAAKQMRSQLALLGMFILSCGAVVVTMTRSLWVVTVLAIIFVFFLSRREEKRRFLGYAGLASGVVFFLALYYMDFTLLVLELLKFRFESFGDGLQDLSLMERVFEIERVWERIKDNPILGWGFGTQYERFDLLRGRTTSTTSYIHNGYLAVWYKLGFFGLMSYLAYCITLFVSAFRILKTATERPIRILSLAIMAYLPAAGLMNMTSPVLYTFEGTLILFTAGSVLSWYMVTSRIAVSDR